MVFGDGTALWGGQIMSGTPFFGPKLIPALICSDSAGNALGHAIVHLRFLGGHTMQLLGVGQIGHYLAEKACSGSVRVLLAWLLAHDSASALAASLALVMLTMSVRLPFTRITHMV